MKIKLGAFSVLFGIFAGCQSSTETTVSNGCPFAPATSNFSALGVDLRQCPTCFLEFSHRDQQYYFSLDELDWVGAGNTHRYKIDHLFALHFIRPSELSQLFNSLNSRSEILHPDSLEENSYDQIRVAFQIQNYCKEEFFPSPEGTIIDSFNEISEIKLLKDNSDDEYTIQEYQASGRFETFIVVNGLREPIKGRYSLIVRLFRKNAVE